MSKQTVLKKKAKTQKKTVLAAKMPAKSKTVDVKPTGVKAGAQPASLLVQPSTLLADPVLKGAAGVAALASLVAVTDGASAEKAGNMLVQVKQFTKQVEERKSYIVKPLKDHARRMEAMFKPTLDKLDEAESSLKQKILTYRAEAEQKAAAETAELMAKAAEAQESGDSDTALVLATEAQNIETTQKTTHFEAGGSMQEKKTWDFEVVDFGSVPHEYFSLDEKKIRLSIRSGLREIPGVRIFQSSQLAVTATSPMMVGDEASLS